MTGHWGLPAAAAHPPARRAEPCGLNGRSPCAQDQEEALDKYEHVVRALQKRGQQVVPLRYRRETPLQPIPVEALCDFEGDQVRPAHPTCLCPWH